MTIFNDITPTAAEVDSVKSSADYSQDLYPDEPTEPLTEQEGKALDARMDETRTDPFARTNTFSDVQPVNIGRGEYIPPKIRQQQKQAAQLPRGKISALEKRLAEVARHEGQPQELSDAITEARAAIKVAHETLERARHPEAPTKAKNPAAKAAALKDIDAATIAVDNVVSISERDDIRAERRKTIESGRADAKAKAAEALEVGCRELTRWLNLVAEGHDLAVASGEFGPDWHRHRDERSINARGLIGDVRRARDLAKTEDPYLSGQYLFEDPTPEGELPEWTRAALMAGNEFERTILWRLDKKHPNDPTAQEAFDSKSLRPILNAPIPALHPDAVAWAAYADNDWN